MFWRVSKLISNNSDLNINHTQLGGWNGKIMSKIMNISMESIIFGVTEFNSDTPDAYKG